MSLAAIANILKRVSELEKQLKRVATKGSTFSRKSESVSISSDSFAVGVRNLLLLLPESGVSDDLSTITGGIDGRRIVLSPKDSGDTITVKTGIGNIELSGDVVLDNPTQSLELIFVKGLDKWVALGSPPAPSTGVDAETLDGLDSTDFSLAGHTHAPGDATTLDGIDSTGFSLVAHNHSGVYSLVGHTHVMTDIVDITAFGRSLIDDPDQATAQATLGLVIGTNVQAFDAELAALAGLTSAADRLPYFTGSGTASLATFTAFARTLLDDANQAAMQSTLGLVPGTNVQAQDAELAAIAGLTSAADRLPYFTGSGTAALAVFTAFGRDLVDSADAAAARTSLALGTMALETATNYVLLAGRATPQTIAFGTASGATAGYLTSTSHATKGSYSLNAAGTIVVDELNTRFGVGGAPPAMFSVVGSLGNLQVDSTGAIVTFTRNAGNHFVGSGASTYFNFITGGNTVSDAAATLRLAANRDVLIPNGGLAVKTSTIATNAIVDVLTAANKSFRIFEAVAGSVGIPSGLTNLGAQIALSRPSDGADGIGSIFINNTNELAFRARTNFKWFGNATEIMSLSELGQLTLTRVAAASAGETLAIFEVSDDTSQLRIENATSANASFIPSVTSYQSSNLIARFDLIRAETDTGTNPLYVADARLNSNAVIATRPLFDWRNFGTSVMRMLANGFLGIGRTSPQGLIHGHDGTGGFIFATKTGVDGTAQVVVSDGTGDVTNRLTCLYTVDGSGGAVGSGNISCPNGSEVNLYIDGSNTFKLRVNANGSVDVRRTAGTQTYTVSLWMVWT